jgi:hypothetical protein
MLRSIITLGIVLAVAAPALAAGPALNHCVFDITEPAIPQNDLAGFNLYLATQSGGPYALLGTFTVAAPGGGATYTSGNMCAGRADGQYFAIAKAIDVTGNESGASPEVPFVLDVTAPAAPNVLKVR